jgi:hypothetical protein
VLITSDGNNALGIEATTNVGGSDGAGLNVINYGTNTPSAIYTECHSTDGSTCYGVQGNAYTEAAGGPDWGGYFNAGVLQDVSSTGLGGVEIVSPILRNSGTSPLAWGVFIQDQCNPAITSCMGIWEDDESTSLSANSYYSWFDSRGVRRVKEDNSVDGVGQAIEALYNNLFTKYTPGATNYERVILGEWNNNVAQIGTEAGGTGTLRPLLLMGSQIGIGTGASVPSTTFQVAGASSTIKIGGTTACIEMANSNGTAGLNYITVLNGVLTATTTKPSACQ